MKKYIQVFLKYKTLLFLLINRDFKLKYRRSVLGVLWSMLNPLLIMFVVSSVFSVMLKINLKEIKMPFSVFYITGSLIFNFFSEATSSSMTAITSNASLIKKVYIPKYIFILEKCTFSLINMLFSTVAVLFVILFYVLKGEVSLNFTIFLSIIPMFFAFLFSIGISLIISILTVFFRDMIHIWGIVLTMWLYLTPIVYPVNILTSSRIEKVVKLNPMYYFVEDLRNLMILGKLPSLQNLYFEVVVCLIVLLIGFVLFKKSQDKFILYI